MSNKNVGRPRGKTYYIPKQIKLTEEENAVWDSKKIHDFLEGNINQNNELVDKLVLLMIKANINSENYGIEITEGEIQSNIQRLQEENKLG